MDEPASDDDVTERAQRSLARDPVRRIGRGAASALLWAVVGGSLVAVWAVLSSDADSLDEGTSQYPSIVMTVRTEVRADSTSARLLVEYDEDDVSSPVGGIVTRAPALPDGIADGDDVVWADVDGRPRVLAVWTADRAFHRRLGLGDEGNDVVLLRDFLADRGVIEPSANVRFDTELQAALVAWRRDVGAGADTALEPGDLMFTSTSGQLLDTGAVEPGSTISPGTPVATIRAATPRLRLRLALPESLEVEVGHTVVGDNFSGRVQSIADQPVDVNGEPFVDIDVAGTPPDDVRPGLSIGVSIAPPTEPALWVPAAALAVDADGGTYVVTPAGDTVAVTTAQEVDGHVSVTGGLVDGDEVVVPNPDLITDAP